MTALLERDMFGQSFFFSKAVKWVAEACGADEDDAKALGLAAGAVLAVATLDATGGTWSAATLGSDKAVESMRDKALDW